MRREPSAGSSLRRAIASIACLALAWMASAEAVTVQVSRFAIVAADDDEASKALRPDEDLLEILRATPFAESLSFSRAEGEEAPLSFLDAARLCELGGCPYLLYGYVKKQDSVYSSELKLLSREGKRIQASFYSTDDAGHYERLVADMARKVSDYFLVDLGVAEGAPPPEPRRNLFEVPLSIGYWSPTGPWSEAMMGVFSVDLGLRFVPRRPWAALKSRPLYFGFGLRGEYGLGMSKPGYEDARFHRIVAKLPVDLIVDFGPERSLGLSLGGVMEFDLFRQERNYSGAYAETSSAGGFLASAFFRYALSDRFAIAFEMECVSLLYEEPLVVVSPRLRAEYSFGGKGRGRDAKDE
jgi:hypothetical protein